MCSSDLHDADIEKDRKDTMFNAGVSMLKDFNNRRHGEKLRDRDLAEKILEGRKEKPKKGK